MRVLLAFLLGITVVLCQEECVSQVEDFYACLTEGKKGKKSGSESGSGEGPDPEKIKEKVEQLNECFTSNDCMGPMEMKECIMENVDFEPMKECLEDQDLGIPPPDFAKFQEKLSSGKGKGPMKMILKKIKMVKSFLGGKVPPFIVAKLEEKIAMACAGADDPDESAGAVKTCLLETLGVEEGDGPPAGFPFPPMGGRGKGKGKGGMPPFINKATKKIFKKMKKCMKKMENKECRKKVIQLAGAVCCCGKKVDIRGTMKAAAEECGVTDTSLVDKIGDKVEKKICRGNPTCD